MQRIRKGVIVEAEKIVVELTAPSEVKYTLETVPVDETPEGEIITEDVYAAIIPVTYVVKKTTTFPLPNSGTIEFWDSVTERTREFDFEVDKKCTIDLTVGDTKPLPSTVTIRATAYIPGFVFKAEGSSEVKVKMVPG